MMHTKEDFERAGRQKKVFAIVPLLTKAGIKPSDLEEALDNEAFWNLLHYELKLDHTSETTRRMVLEKLREHEQVMTAAILVPLTSPWTQDDIRDGEAAAKERACRRERAEEMD